MTTIPNETPSPSTPAQQRIARMRAIASEFPDADPRPLTVSELRLITITPAEFLEKGALFAESHPGIGQNLDPDLPAMLRQAVVFDTENDGLVDEANALIRRIEMSSARTKLKAVKIVRALYRIAKGFVTADVGDLSKTRVQDMQRALKSKTNRRNGKNRAKRAELVAQTAVVKAEKGEGEK
jgi:hypothetical protein